MAKTKVVKGKTTYTVDPNRKDRAIGIRVAARDDGVAVRVDISRLDKKSFRSWVRDTSDERSREKEDILGILFGHGRLNRQKPLAASRCPYCGSGDIGVTDTLGASPITCDGMVDLYEYSCNSKDCDSGAFFA